MAGMAVVKNDFRTHLLHQENKIEIALNFTPQIGLGII
jgi:hypothetical protein